MMHEAYDCSSYITGEQGRDRCGKEDPCGLQAGWTKLQDVELVTLQLVDTHVDPTGRTWDGYNQYCITTVSVYDTYIYVTRSISIQM